MNKKFKSFFGLWKFFVVILMFSTILSSSVFAAKDLSYDGYNYDAYSVSTPSPEGYEPMLRIRGEDMPCGAFKSPEDIFYAKDNKIYIADTGNNRIVVLNKDFSFLNTIDTISFDGITEPLNKPNGVFVQGDNIYIVQSDNQRVLRCDLQGNVVSQFLRPVSDVFSDDMTYTPTKVLVNNSGTVYVLVKNFVYGALTYSPEGDFLNFYGSNKVTATLEVLLDSFWKQIMSKEQVDQMKRYVPIEYANFCIDEENFIYTVTKEAKEKQVRRLNTLGNNVLPVYERNLSSATDKFGDLERQKISGVWTTNKFTDIAVDTDGFINILDQENGRVFQFDPESRLLHIFGGNSNSGFGFAKATSIETVGSEIAVVDSGKNTITVFKPTEYGALVKDAVMLYNDGFYSQAADAWEQIVVRNQNFELAYDGLGKAAFENGDYTSAMKYYKLAFSRDGYSDAFKEFRAYFLRGAFPYIGTILLVAFVAYFFIKKKVKFNNKLSNTVTANVLLSPNDTIFEMKYHKRFSFKVVFAVLLLLFLSIISERQLTAFTFNHNNLQKGNMLVVLFAMIFVFIVFCAVNWCITSLLDGKGNFKEISCSTAYALIPYVASTFVSVVLSYFLTADEKVFMTVVMAVGLLWSVYLLISAFKTIHEYSFLGAVLSILLTIVGVLIVIFLCVLLVGLLQQIISFFATIYNEIMYRQ